MANFSPTLQFSKRWRATPTAVKQAFLQELTDIKHMLASDIHAKEYQFTHADFGGAVQELLTTQQNEPKEPTKLVHSIDTTPLHEQPAPSELDEQEILTIEQQIYDKLSAQLDDFLSEHMAQLGEDLKTWIKTTVKNELADHKANQTQANSQD